MDILLQNLTAITSEMGLYMYHLSFKNICMPSSLHVKIATKENPGTTRLFPYQPLVGRLIPRGRLQKVEEGVDVLLSEPH